MLQELTQFVQEVPPLIKEKAIEPKSGLHILIGFSESGNAEVKGAERYLGKKHDEISDFLKECAVRQELSWMINTNKCFDLPAKGIHSASPFCVAFKRESWIGGDKYPTDSSKPDVVERLEGYFAKCFDDVFGLDDAQKQKALQFKNYLKNNLEPLLSSFGEYPALEQGEYILLFNDIGLEEHEAFNSAYLAQGLFNTDTYNIAVDDEVFGTSNFHNGFNSKKPFLTHQTASFDITIRISASEAKALTEFSAMAGKKLFPNPTPIFIEKKELTSEAIRIFHREEDKKHSHRKIIKELLKKEEELGNYYLLYYSGGVIRDFDFVPKFQYYLDSAKDEQGLQRAWKIHNVTELKEKGGASKSLIHLKDVFDFEWVVVRQLFNNSLVKIDEKKKEISLRYFDELDSKYYRPAYYTLMLKYRKPIYDFIYKSMRSGIRSHQFQDICMTGIMDDLKENKEYAIKMKLNIFFSLYNHFTTNQNIQFMPSKIEGHKSHLQEVLENEETHFSSDEAYAYGAGQLIYYLLSQSQAGDRTHALLEPFLQKTNYAHFNEAISNIILKYKHAIGFDFRRFNALSGEVLDYEAERPLTELRPVMLAGYFSPNILYKSTKTDPELQNN